MTAWLAVTVGVLSSVSVYLLLSRQSLRFLFGAALIGNATNLAFFSVAGARVAVPPVVPIGLNMPETAMANPLPQAMILTSVVISFGLTAFLLVLAFRIHQELGGADTDHMRMIEIPPDRPEAFDLAQSARRPEHPDLTTSLSEPPA